MFIHNILRGFTNTGLDYYIVKSLSHNGRFRPGLVYKQTEVHNPHGENYLRMQLSRIDEPATSHSRPSHPDQSRRLPPGYERHPFKPHKLMPAGLPDSLKKESPIPGACWYELIGPNEDDSHLINIFPEFHNEYTTKLEGKKSGIGQYLDYIDWTHFPKRIQQRGFVIAKNPDEYNEYIKDWDIADVGVEKLVEQWPPDVQEKLVSVDPKQVKLIAQHIRNTLAHPAAVQRVSHDLSPWGLTKYFSWECCVAVLNLPNNQGVIKSFYPTNLWYRYAMEHGWDGTTSLTGYREQVKEMLNNAHDNESNPDRDTHRKRCLDNTPVRKR